jgi:hypothetical protein
MRIFVILTLAALQLSAQNTLIEQNFWWHMPAINHASASLSKPVELNLSSFTHREISSNYSFHSVDASVRVAKWNSSVTLGMHDAYTFWGNHYYVGYAYAVTLKNEGVLSFGLSFHCTNYQSLSDNADDLLNPYIDFTYNPKYSMQLGGAVFYRHNNTYVGISNQPGMVANYTLSNFGDDRFDAKHLTSIVAGTAKNIASKIEWLPAILIRTDGQRNLINVNNRFRYNNWLTAGFGYVAQTNDGHITQFIVGLQAKKALQVQYVFGRNWSDMSEGYPIPNSHSICIKMELGKFSEPKSE